MILQAIGKFKCVPSTELQITNSVVEKAEKSLVLLQVGNHWACGVIVSKMGCNE